MPKKDITNEELLEAILNLSKTTDKRFDKVDQRFESIDMRLFNIENDITEIKADIIDLKASHDKLLSTLINLLPE